MEHIIVALEKENAVRGRITAIAKLAGLSPVGVRKIAERKSKNPGLLTLRKIERAMADLNTVANCEQRETANA